MQGDLLRTYSIAKPSRTDLISTDCGVVMLLDHMNLPCEQYGFDSLYRPQCFYLTFLFFFKRLIKIAENVGFESLEKVNGNEFFFFLPKLPVVAVSERLPQ